MPVVVAAAVFGAAQVAASWPSADGFEAGELDVELPPPAPAPPGDVAPPTRADTPPAPVRCRSDIGCLRWRLPATPPGAGPAAVTDGGVLAALVPDGLSGFDVRSGSWRWGASLELQTAAPASVVPVEGADTLVLVGAGNRLVAVDADTGEPRWEQGLAGAVGARAARAAGDTWYLAVRVREGLTSSVAVLAVDADTGERRWRRDGANAVLTAARPVLQDVDGTLRGLDPTDGEGVWERATERPGARLAPLGELVVVTASGHGLAVDAADGTLIEEVAHPLSSLFVRDDVLLWGTDTTVEYLDGGRRRWTTELPPGTGCCSGFAAAADTVTTLTGRGELLELDRDTGEVLGSGALPAPFTAARGSAWLHGPLVVVPVERAPRGLAQVHDAATGTHLADVTQDAYGLARTDAGSWVVLAPELALTLRPDELTAPGQASSRPLGSARTR
ncbi:PQQ-binding-like beta-propeller repeat protein [Egicoccus sp. AB-alg2]|uniref:outer membrane protein assembly factor BamB family protein n=1 Tax=Egicoccus sp. AB-alg2 TaxID=3242693 RepID=UPI00359E1111